MLLYVCFAYILNLRPPQTMIPHYSDEETKIYTTVFPGSRGRTHEMCRIDNFIDE
jgi:hypothetical protein